MERAFYKVNDGRVDLEYFSDDISAHYFLSADLFHIENEILKLINQYDGACTENYDEHAMQVTCDFNCVQCSRSIYHLARKKERFFKKRCADLCARYPKPGDEWEISLIAKDGVSPKYRNYFFRCNEVIADKRIIELLFEAMTEYYPKGYQKTHYCYIKIRRFDMPKAIDASIIGNRYLETFIEGGTFDDVHVDLSI